MTEQETAALIKLTGPTGQLVPLVFGPGWAAIDTSSPYARWALVELARLRGLSLAT